MSPTITALEPQQRSQERVSVYLDGDFAFGLPLIESARLHVGQELTEAEVSTLRHLDDVARALDRAVRLLARRPYSTVEIRRNLHSKQFAAPTIDEVLAKLEDLGYVDDRAFAQYWIENREQFRPRSPRALAHELRQKGLPDPLIREALAGLDGQESAYRAGTDYLRRLHGLTQEEFRRKMSAYLGRRGFEYDIVRDVVDRLIGELERTQPEFLANDTTTDEE